MLGNVCCRCASVYVESGGSRTDGCMIGKGVCTMLAAVSIGIT